MTPNETEILQLREMVEASVSRKMKTPADFQFVTPQLLLHHRRAALPRQLRARPQRAHALRGGQ